MPVYAKVQGSTLIQFPYTEGSLQAENPYTNFGPDPDIAAIFPLTETAITNGYSLVEVHYQPQPQFNSDTQVCVQGNQPIYLNDAWVIEWTVRDLTDAERIAKMPTVTDLQFRLALNQLGLREAADTYINSASQDVKDWWDRALNFQFTNPMLQAAMTALGKTQNDLEQLFKLAKTL
jgi:hypothetical protein